MSASRSTDIPAFYADWFFHRLKAGYSAWTNPFNGVKSYVSYRDTRFIVFWSKNPRPLLPHLDELGARGIHCYVQYTMNDYEKEGLEKGVPPLKERIDTFKELVDNLGEGRVVRCFDPLMLTASKDIGEYNTCPHLCEYCYANTSKETAVRRWEEHQRERFGEMIAGK